MLLILNFSLVVVNKRKTLIRHQQELEVVVQSPGPQLMKKTYKKLYFNFKGKNFSRGLQKRSTVIILLAVNSISNI